MLQVPQQEFSVSRFDQAGGSLVEVVGDFHLMNVGLFQESLQSVIEDYDGNVDLDFRQVGFMDSAGLKALLDLRKQLSIQSRLLSLMLIARSQPDRVLRTSRVQTIITLVYE